MPFTPEKRYDLSDVPGGNSDENHDKMKDAVQRIKHSNGHLEEDDIEKIAKCQVWPDGWQRAGGQ
jgi:hypothetical protein